MSSDEELRLFEAWAVRIGYDISKDSHGDWLDDSLNNIEHGFIGGLHCVVKQENNHDTSN